MEKTYDWINLQIINGSGKPKEDTYIYERNSDTGEVFRRKSGDYDSPRELIDNLL